MRDQDSEPSPSASPARCEEQIMLVTRKRGRLIERIGVEHKQVDRWAPGVVDTAALRDPKIRFIDTTRMVRGKVKTEAILRDRWSGFAVLRIHRADICRRGPIGELAPCRLGSRGEARNGESQYGDQLWPL